MNFEKALSISRNGGRVTRTGWNGQIKFIFHVPGSQFQVNRPPLLGIYKKGTTINYAPHIDMCTIDDIIAPFTFSQIDVHADDWHVFLEEPEQLELPLDGLRYVDLKPSVKDPWAEITWNIDACK